MNTTFGFSQANDGTTHWVLTAGIMRGVGDYRPEKGKGDYGQFELVAANDPRFLAVIKDGGRRAQDAALANPSPYDAESAELLTWYGVEAENDRGPRRGGHQGAGTPWPADAGERSRGSPRPREPAARPLRVGQLKGWSGMAD